MELNHAYNPTEFYNDLTNEKIFFFKRRHNILGHNVKQDVDNDIYTYDILFHIYVQIK